jgi:release factor glutamine methyltransferase
MAEPWTILKVLDWTKSHFEEKGIDSPRLDAELILANALGLQRVMLYAKFDQPLS